MHLLCEEKSGNIIRRIYACPCGKGRIVEEQDYTPGHRDGNAFIECDICKQHYPIDFGTSATKWRLYHDYTSYYPIVFLREYCLSNDKEKRVASAI